jgi:hypothetical protein
MRITSRYTLAQQIKNECWELIGMSRQRMGSVTASESATGVNTAVQQSYAQTEPLFVAHEYVMGQLYQSIIDAALYVESQKPQSTLSYITSEGESAFVQVNGTDLKFRDLKVFLTNRPEDTQMFNEIRSLSQAVIQNGGTLYDVIELYSTKSMREMKKVFKDLKDRQQQMQDQQMQQQQQQIDQQREIAAAQMEQAQAIKEQEITNENYQNDLDRLNKKEIAIIAAEAKGGLPDTNENQVPDVLEMSNLMNQQTKLTKDYELKMADIQSKSNQSAQKIKLEQEKLKVARENMQNDLEIAKVNAKNRANKSKK